MVWQAEVDEIGRRRGMAYEMGGPERVADQHARNKLTIRERIAALVDEDSFLERGVLAGSAEYAEDGLTLVNFLPASYVAGIAQLDGRPVVVGGGDFTSRSRPSAGERGQRTKQAEAQAIALDLKLPLVSLLDGFGADIRTIEAIGRTYLGAGGFGGIFIDLMGEVPVVCAALGSVAGAPAGESAACHFNVMVKGVSQIFAAGPPLVKRALGMDIDKEDLGGYRVHARASGLVDNEAEDESDAFRQIRAFLSYMPSNIYEAPPVCETDDPSDRREEELLSLIPRERNRPYLVRKMVELIVDRGSAFEMSRYFGPSQVTMLARVAGRPVGILANDPMSNGGAMDASAAQKLERFVDLCDTFHLPVINFVDQPGFMIGPAAERSGTLRHGMSALAAIHQAKIPWATVVVRRWYGVAGAGQQAGGRFNFRVAWPSGEWGSLPIEGGVAAAYRREIEAAADPDAHRKSIEDRMIAVRSPFRTAEAFSAEDIIDPRDTRSLLTQWVELAYRVLPTQLGPRERRIRP